MKNENFLCFTGNTEITIAGSCVKLIQDMGIGDKILAYDAKKNIFVIDKVAIVAMTKHKSKAIIDLDDGLELQCTPEHPLYIKNKGWSSVNPKGTKKGYDMDVFKINIGDICLHYNGTKVEEVTINEINILTGEYDMYTVSTIGKNSFFANGIVVSDGNISSLDLDNYDEIYYQQIVA